MNNSRYNATHETTFGVMAAPEAFSAFKNPKRPAIEVAARSLHEKFYADPKTHGKVSVGIGADNILLLYLSSSKKNMDIPETWEGYSVKSKVSGPTVAFST